MTWPPFLRRLLIARALRRIIQDGGRENVRNERALRRRSASTAPLGYTLSDWANDQPYSYRLTPPTQHEAPPKLPAGRQAIRMPNTASVFGQGGWAGLIPAEAHDAAWEDCHTFAPGDRPKRELWGMVGGPPIALICVGCELAQPPIQTPERDCPYCGLHYRLHGTRLFWWRNHVAEVPEWKP